MDNRWSRDQSENTALNEWFQSGDQNKVPDLELVYGKPQSWVVGRSVFVHIVNSSFRLQRVRKGKVVKYAH